MIKPAWSLLNVGMEVSIKIDDAEQKWWPLVGFPTFSYVFLWFSCVFLLFLAELWQPDIWSTKRAAAEHCRWFHRAYVTTTMAETTPLDRPWRWVQVWFHWSRLQNGWWIGPIFQRWTAQVAWQFAVGLRLPGMQLLTRPSAVVMPSNYHIRKVIQAAWTKPTTWSRRTSSSTAIHSSKNSTACCQFFSPSGSSTHKPHQPRPHRCVDHPVAIHRVTTGAAPRSSIPGGTSLGCEPWSNDSTTRPGSTMRAQSLIVMTCYDYDLITNSNY